VLAPGLRYWSEPGAPQLPLLLHGSTRPARERAFTAICHGCGLLPFGIDAADIPDPARDREQLARLWSREAALRSAALYIRTENLESIRDVSGLLRVLETHVAVEVCPGGPAEVLEGTHVHAAGGTSRERRAQARSGLRNLATRVEPAAGWTDLVLPEAQLSTLRQLAANVRHKDLVNGQWGFAARHPRGLGVTALFTGGSGTGKTTAAEVIAAALDLDLYRIDLATVVSKYIGETEKNLREIFGAATDTDAILLFDEADALFGKRSEVRDSHDRYANLEVSYLLQQMEAYQGAAILTTNMPHVLDPAFLRRLRFIVQFPFPDAAARARIWRGIFPTATPVGDLDFDRLAQLGVTGGTIRNIATLAAFLAAGDGERVETRHLLAAIRTEYAKLDKPLTAAETRGLT
jgi:ATPase family associated with various cellular activities (AAA)